MSAFALEDGAVLPRLFRLRARPRRPVGRVSVARPRPQGPQRDSLLVASPRRVRQALRQVLIVVATADEIKTSCAYPGSVLQETAFRILKLLAVVSLHLSQKPAVQPISGKILPHLTKKGEEARDENPNRISDGKAVGDEKRPSGAKRSHVQRPDLRANLLSDPQSNSDIKSSFFGILGPQRSGPQSVSV
jgi:hypothetical protein